MAIHKVCPEFEGKTFEEVCEMPIIGTSLFAPRCKMIAGGCCRGNGVTPGSLYNYCEGCSDYYRICESCGEPL